MQLVIQTFLNPVFPVFAIMLVGIIMGRRGFFDQDAARALNKFVFYVVLPPLIFSLIMSATLEELNYRLVFFYYLAEIFLIVVSTIIIRKLLRRSLAESVLLGMASGFANHVFFILPIVTELYGDAARAPLTALIFVDTILIFGGMTMCMEVVAHRGQSAGKVFLSFVRNPVLIAMTVALIINALGFELHEGVETFTSFAGHAAPPVSLFALGVILAQRRFLPLDSGALVITLIKIIVHPLLVWCLFSWAGGHDPVWAPTIQLTAAAPCGAMPFVLALQYRVKADSIGLAIVYSTIASLITLSIIA